MTASKSGAEPASARASALASGQGATRGASTASALASALGQPLSIRRVARSSLRPDPANVRAHNERNLDAIQASLSRFGQRGTNDQL